jgi:hypothetical protein
MIELIPDALRPVLFFALLLGPTIAWVLYRLARGQEKRLPDAPHEAVVDEGEWFCPTCHSLNRVGTSRCYRGCPPAERVIAPVVLDTSPYPMVAVGPGRPPSTATEAGEPAPRAIPIVAGVGAPAAPSTVVVDASSSVRTSTLARLATADPAAALDLDPAAAPVATSTAAAGASAREQPVYPDPTDAIAEPRTRSKRRRGPAAAAASAAATASAEADVVQEASHADPAAATGPTRRGREQRSANRDRTAASGGRDERKTGVARPLAGSGLAALFRASNLPPQGMPVVPPSVPEAPAASASTSPTVAVTGACPYLGLRGDARSRFEFADSKHRCYATAPPATIDAGHQRSYCFGDCERCFRYPIAGGAARR